MAYILKGNSIARALTDPLVEQTQQLQKIGVFPSLAILRVGARQEDISYETAILNRCAKIGIRVKRFIFPKNCTKEQIIDAVERINSDKYIHGCLVLRPLPDRAIEEAVCNLLAPEKDVDCITPESLAGVFMGKSIGYPPCTAQACIEILDHYGIEIKGKQVTVIGRSLVIGKPVSIMLENRDATVTMCHTKTSKLKDICKSSEIIVAAAGNCEMIDTSYVSAGQIIIDVGVNTNKKGEFCGDVKFDKVESVVSAITPVPGGVGAVTTSVLCKHVVEAAERTQV